MQGSAARKLSIVGFVLATLPFGVAWLPTVSSETVASAGPNGPELSTTSTLSLVESHGATVVLPFVIAALLASIPVMVWNQPSARRARVVTAVVFGVGVVLSLASIGMFYLPALIALILAVRFSEPAGTHAPAH